MDKLKLRWYWGSREELEETLAGSERLRNEANRPVSQTMEGFPKLNTHLLSFSKNQKILILNSSPGTSIHKIKHNEFQFIISLLQLLNKIENP